MSDDIRCVCGRKPVNDAGVCETCHYHCQGETVDGAVSQIQLLKALFVERHVFGTESMIVEMEKIYNELKWDEKQKDS